MKTEIKSKVESLMNAYKEDKQGYKNKIAEWERDNLYSLDFKAEKIKALEQEAEQNDLIFNERIRNLIQDEKKSAIGEPEAKPADYQVKISNALKFLELAGSKLTDDQAYNILKPFQADYETMQLFQAAMGGLVKNGGVWDAFHRTFDKTNEFLALVNSFEIAEKTADNLFNFKVDSLHSAVRTDMFIGAVKQIEKLASKIDAA